MFSLLLLLVLFWQKPDQTENWWDFFLPQQGKPHIICLEILDKAAPKKRYYHGNSGESRLRAFMPSLGTFEQKKLCLPVTDSPASWAVMADTHTFVWRPRCNSRRITLIYAVSRRIALRRGLNRHAQNSPENWILNLKWLCVLGALKLGVRRGWERERESNYKLDKGISEAGRLIA